ncbi:MAG: translocation/assembly module TamB domain-containing protein [Blastocatellia bacterium]
MADNARHAAVNLAINQMDKAMPKALKRFLKKLLNPRKLLFAALALLLLVLALWLIAVYLVRQGHVDRWIIARAKIALADYGVRAEIGGLQTDLRAQTVELRDLQLYTAGGQTPFASLKQLRADFDLRQLPGFLGYGRGGEIELRKLVIDGLRGAYKIDAQGRSNLAGIHLPDKKTTQNFEFLYRAAQVELTNAEFEYLDQPHKLAGAARNLRVTLSPDQNNYTRITARADNSDFTFDGRPSAGISLDLTARANETGALIDALKLDSPLVSATLKGELRDWREFAYQFDTVADVRAREIARLFAPDLRLAGALRFEGVVSGKGTEYQSNGKIRGHELLVRDIRIEGLDLNANIKGDGADYGAKHELLIRTLSAAGFRVNRLTAAGKIAGNGEDFSWLGNLGAGEVSGKDLRTGPVNFRDALIKGNIGDPASVTVKGRVSIPTLVTANVPVGNINGDVTATRNEIKVTGFSGAVFGGGAKGSAKISLDGRQASTLQADLTKLNLEQAAAVAAQRRIPLRGLADGRVNLSWTGNDYRGAVGTVNLQFNGSTLKQDGGGEKSALIDGLPVSGAINLLASNRRLRLENTELKTGATTLSLSGDLGWDGSGAIDVALDSPDAIEAKTLALDLARVYGVPEATLADIENNYTLTDRLGFNGKVTGTLANPRVDGRFSLGGLTVNDEYLGSLSGNVLYEAQSVSIREGALVTPEGGRADFSLGYPLNAENAATLSVKLGKFPLSTLVRQQFATVKAEGTISGEATLEGLPGAIRGRAAFSGADVTFNGRKIDELISRVSFSSAPAGSTGGNRVDVENIRLRASGGVIEAAGGAAIGFGAPDAAGKRNFQVRDYRVTLKGERLDLGDIAATINEGNTGQDNPGMIPPIAGLARLQLEASGAEFSLAGARGRIFDQLTASLTSEELRYREETLGHVNLTATGRDSRATLNLQAELFGQSYTGAGDIDFGNPDFPVNATVNLRETSLARVLDLLAGEGAIRAGGVTSGALKINGLLAKRESLQLEAALSQLVFDIKAATGSGADYRLTAQPPVNIKYSGQQIDLGTIRLSGANTNLVARGSFALDQQGAMDLSLSGDVNPKILQSFAPDLFADGQVRIEAAVRGTAAQPRFNGTATLQNGSLRTPDYPLALTRANGRLRFTADQAQIEKLTADIGGGKMEMTGGAAFVGFRPDRWRFQIKSTGVRLDYPRDTRTTLDGDLVLQGGRQLQVLEGLVNVRRAEYLAEANLFELIERITAEFSGGGGPAGGEEGPFPPTQFDIRLIADDSLIIRTKTLDLVGGATMQIRGRADDINVGGRITITRGLIDDFLQSQTRYRVTTGVIEFSGVSGKLPRVNIEAETEIGGYRPIILVSGPADKLKFAVRSEPPLTEREVVSLITTGRLPDDRGLNVNNAQSVAQTSINTVAQVATQSLSRSIESNVTGRLFGLNRFSIDPLLTGRGADPTARITVGRRVTRDLSITYSTNVASNQDQVILIEYRASDKMSFVASREQNGTFALDIRLRKRF